MTIARPTIFAELHSSAWCQRVGTSVRTSRSGSRPTAVLNLMRPWFAVRSGITFAAPRGSLAQDVALVVEIAQSSLSADREMIRVYGPAGIPVYWIVNLVDRQVEVYSGPQPDGYGKRDIYRSGEDVPVVVDGIIVGRIAVDDLLP